MDKLQNAAGLGFDNGLHHQLATASVLAVWAIRVHEAKAGAAVEEYGLFSWELSK